MAGVILKKRANMDQRQIDYEFV